MTADAFDAALEAVVARTGVGRYRHLCSDANTLPAPNAPADWRAWVLTEAARLSAGEPQYPGLLEMAAAALAAAGRVAAAAVMGEPIRVPGDVLARRRALCQSCEHWDPEQARCRRCGCTGLKLELATERCPLEPPRWGRWERPAPAPAE